MDISWIFDQKYLFFLFSRIQLKPAWASSIWLKLTQLSSIVEPTWDEPNLQLKALSQLELSLICKIMIEPAWAEFLSESQTLAVWGRTSKGPNIYTARPLPALLFLKCGIFLTVVETWAEFQAQLTALSLPAQASSSWLKLAQSCWAGSKSPSCSLNS